MGYLDPIVQVFVADASRYLGPIRDMKTAALEAMAANDKLAESCVMLIGTIDDVAKAADGAANRLGDYRNAAATTAGADTALAESMNAVRESVDANTAAVAVLSGRMNDLRDAMAGAALAAGLLAKANTGAAMTGLAAGAVNAGNGFRLLGTGMRLTGTTLHWIIAGTAELLAVLIPATVAAGAWASAWLQGAVNVYEHMNAVYVATEATANVFHETAGQAVGLGDALQKAQNAANPQVYQALGGALNMVKETAGGLAQVGLQIGSIFDAFMGKLVYDFSAAGGGAKQLSGLLSGMVPDLVEIGQIFGNLGHALVNLAGDMPGLAQVLLQVVDAVSRFILFLSELPRPLIMSLMAMEEFARWGGLLVGVMGRMGFATTALEGNFSSISGFMARFGSVALNLVRAPLLLVTGAVENVGATLALLPGRLGAAGAAMEAFGAEAGAAVATMSTFGAVLVLAAAVAIGVLIDKIVNAKQAYQQFDDAVQQTVSNAKTPVNALNAIGSAMQQLTNRAEILSQTGIKVGNTMIYGTYSSKAFSDALAGADTTVDHLGQQVEQVTMGATHLAQKFGMTVPQAMAAAGQAGVNLTQKVMNQKGQLTALGDQVWNTIAGYEAMGQTSGNVGHDIEMVGLQSALAGTDISKLTQAFDQFMQNVTGGTGGLAAFSTSLQNIGQVAGTTSHNLGTATGTMSLSTAQFASALTSYVGKGAGAWTNFDQIVGQTMPQLANWFQTAAAEGAIGSKQFNQAILDMIKPMVPFAAKSKTAQDALIAFAQANKLNISKFPQLEAALKASHASFAGLESITNSTSDAMSNLSQISQNMSGVMDSQVTSAISSASLKASGFYQAESNLTAAIQKFGANSPQAESAAKAVASSLQHAADMANAVAAGATNATRALDAVPRYIPITMTLTEKVIGSLGGYTGGGVGVNLPGNGGGGHQGPGVVLSGAAAGGNVTIVHQNIAGTVLSDQALARAVQGATLRKTVRNASTQTYLPGRLH